MTTVPDRRTRKRLATRQTISDAATRLFFERGFDRVTVDEIADAADVGRMTVFNHFPRKEDMFFDQDQEARDVVLDAVRSRSPGVAPVEALRLLAHQLIAEDRSYIRFFDGSRRFVETVAASEALKARSRSIRDEAAQSLTVELAASVKRPADDPDAILPPASFWQPGLSLLSRRTLRSDATEAPRRPKLYSWLSWIRVAWESRRQ